jgi:hypothetical protein
MKLARFWTRQPGEATDRRGRRVRVTSRGWSNESPEAAAAVARDLARKVAERIAAGQPKARQYGYGDRPLPEPVIQELRDESGTANAVITRNVYGALVMNARDLMFVDIDREGSAVTAGQASVTDVAQELVSGIAALFGKQPAAPPPTPVQQPITASSGVAGIQRVAERNNVALRIYQTAAGYRALILSARFDPVSAQSEALLRDFGCDPLYMRLCKMQESFRARLTPKPWRMGMSQPPVSFPFEGPDQEARFYQWVAKYTAASAGYATCRFVGAFGAGAVKAGFAPLIAYHDQETKASSGLPLA